MRRMTNREIDGILNGLKTLRIKYNEYGDKCGAEPGEKYGDEIVDDLIDSLCRYTATVFDHNFLNANIAKSRDEANQIEDYRDKVEQIDIARKNAHDTLIVNIRSVDAVCRKLGIPEIYGELPDEYKEDTKGLMGNENRSRPGVVETRHAIADWAWGFMVGAVISLDINIDTKNLDYDKNAQDIQAIGRAYNQRRAKKILDELTR